MTARRWITREANVAFPREACGFVVEGTGVVACRNVAEDPLVGFQIDPGQAEAWWATGRVRAVWHSHPWAGVVPSLTDEELAPPGIETWIYSVPDEELAVYRKDEAGRLQLVRLEAPGMLWRADEEATHVS